MCCNGSCESLNDLLCLIVKLQKQGQCFDGGIQSCDRPFLGINNNNVFNTRPITLYTSNNTLFEAPYTLGDTSSTSSVFRVEKVTSDSATLRVLAPNPDTTSIFPYVKTESFLVVNCNCICAIQCLADTFVDCV